MQDENKNKIDAYSMVFGILLSLVAQGIWNVIYDYTMNNTLSMFAQISLLFIVVVIVIDVALYYLMRNAKKTKKIQVTV